MGSDNQHNANLYSGVRPDAFTDWSTRKWTVETGKSLAIKWIDGEYEKAVDEQRKELREYKKRAKSQTQLPEEEPVHLTIEEDLSQGDKPEPIKA